MVAPHLTKVLLIEDNPGDVRLVQTLLCGDRQSRYALVDVPELEAAQVLLSTQTFDVVLVDLGLPDSEGIATLRKLIDLHFDIPVIVLTGDLSEEQSIGLIKAGAQDYLTKGHIDRELLQRSVDYAIERYRLHAELNQSRRDAERQRELLHLEKLSTARHASATADSFGELSLRIADPKIFELLVEEYGVFILEAMEQRIHGEIPGLESRIQGFAQRLGALRGKPKDLTEIHVAACRAAMKNAKQRRREGISSESQLLLIEIMGYLALYYRTYMGPTPHRRKPAKAIKEPMDD